jgi:hypothetical protein
MYADYITVIFDFRHNISKGENLVEGFENGSQAISRLRVSFILVMKRGLFSR